VINSKKIRQRADEREIVPELFPGTLVALFVSGVNLDK
jgi:hypothetical protein